MKQTLIEPSLSAIPTGDSIAVISWDTGDGSNGEIYVSQDGGPESLVGLGPAGRIEAPWISRGSVYRFALYGADRAFGPLATAEVPEEEPPASQRRPGALRYRCNICSRITFTAPEDIAREHPSCRACGSTVRFRSVIATLSRELFGRVLPLDEFPERPEIVGAGLSDWYGYAIRLERKFDYTNTYYHQEPRLDICDINPADEERFDFLIASDVFEHVNPPVEVAFENLRRVLKPGGFAVFTVPYSQDESTREHFPDLHRFDISEVGGEYVLKNISRSGVFQRFDNLVFHGGPGATLEMRVFSEKGLERAFRNAGLSMRICSEALPEFGITWGTYPAFPIIARRLQQST